MTRLSVVVPVYRSEAIVGKMIERTLAVLSRIEGEGELVLVHDASPDDSLAVLEEWAARDPRVVVCDLARNVGQHRALFLGMLESRGDWIATLDDDLQNPPEELLPMLEATADSDLVFGRFKQKQHAAVRVGGSRLVTRLNRLLYGLPSDLLVSNVRLLSRAVFERMRAYDAGRIYLTGWAILAAERPSNVEVEHAAREVGPSTYGMRRLTKLFFSVLLAHPRMPFRGPAPAASELVARVLRTGDPPGQ